MKENTKNNNQIVTTDQKYTYISLKKDLKKLKETYPFLEIKKMGNSVLGKEIPYIRIGEGANEILYHASIHANEWITTLVLMKFVEKFCKAYIQNQSIQGYQAKELFSKTSLYIIPMVNPDGVDLVTGNIDKESNIYQNYVNISKSFPQINFPDGWKANFNGVDLKIYQPIYKVL